MVKIRFGKRFKKELGVWQICANASIRKPWHLKGFHPSLMLSCMKLNSFPSDGCTIGKENYSGFIFSVELSFDCVLKQKFIRLPSMHIFLCPVALFELYRFYKGFMLRVWKFRFYLKRDDGKTLRIVYPIRIRPKLYFGL